MRLIQLTGGFSGSAGSAWFNLTRTISNAGPLAVVSGTGGYTYTQGGAKGRISRHDSKGEEVHRAVWYYPTELGKGIAVGYDGYLYSLWQDSGITKVFKRPAEGGNHIWGIKVPECESVSAVAVTAAGGGAVWVMGLCAGQPALSKFSTAGVYLSQTRFSAYTDVPAICVDTLGNLYLTGNSGTGPISTILDSTGTPLAYTRHSIAGVTMKVAAVTLASDGYYFTGTYQGPPNNTYQWLVVKASLSLELQWAKVITQGSNIGTGKAITAAPGGGVFVCASLGATPDLIGGLIARLSPDGTLLWVRGIADTSGGDISGIAWSPDGLTVCGNVTSSVPAYGTRGFTARLPDGGGGTGDYGTGPLGTPMVSYRSTTLTPLDVTPSITVSNTGATYSAAVGLSPTTVTDQMGIIRSFYAIS